MFDQHPRTNFYLFRFRRASLDAISRQVSSRDRANCCEKKRSDVYMPRGVFGCLWVSGVAGKFDDRWYDKTDVEERDPSSIRCATRDVDVDCIIKIRAKAQHTEGTVPGQKRAPF